MSIYYGCHAPSDSRKRFFKIARGVIIGFEDLKKEYINHLKNRDGEILDGVHRYHFVEYIEVDVMNTGLAILKLYPSCNLQSKDLGLFILYHKNIYAKYGFVYCNEINGMVREVHGLYADVKPI